MPPRPLLWVMGGSFQITGDFHSGDTPQYELFWFVRCPFWSEAVYRFWQFRSEIGCGFVLAGTGLVSWVCSLFIYLFIYYFLPSRLLKTVFQVWDSERELHSSEWNRVEVWGNTPLAPHSHRTRKWGTSLHIFLYIRGSDRLGYRKWYSRVDKTGEFI